jgi:hypothetical protein
MFKGIKHVVYSHREGLRWYFIDTNSPENGPAYFISLNPRDIKYLICGGIHFLLPPFNKSHIKGNW